MKRYLPLRQLQPAEHPQFSQVRICNNKKITLVYWETLAFKCHNSIKSTIFYEKQDLLLKAVSLQKIHNFLQESLQTPKRHISKQIGQLLQRSLLAPDKKQQKNPGFSLKKDRFFCCFLSGAKRLL